MDECILGCPMNITRILLGPLVFAPFIATESVPGATLKDVSNVQALRAIDPAFPAFRIGCGSTSQSGARRGADQPVRVALDLERLHFFDPVSKLAIH